MTDNQHTNIVAAPVAQRVQVPLVSWSGTDKLLNDRTFRLGNGDCGGDAAFEQRSPWD